MPHRLRAVAFDLDAASLVSLREALPEWEIDVVKGSKAASLDHDWNPSAADLLVVGARDKMAETLGLCRGLRSQVGRAKTPLLALLSPAQEALVRVVLEAGANSCLILPVHAKDLVSTFTRALAGNQPGRHTLGLDRAQHQDQWRDDGGEA
jgi:DNA-binding response OmpR family regulator